MTTPQEQTMRDALQLALNEIKALIAYSGGGLMTDRTLSAIKQAIAPQEPTPQPAPHTDDLAVDRFAAALKQKLSLARAKGRSGWEQMQGGELSSMLHQHVIKGDPRDVANFCVFLWNLGLPIEPAKTVEDNSQNWAGMDGATAWRIIHRHADGWADIGKMMQEWLAANTNQPAPMVRLTDGEFEQIFCVIAEGLKTSVDMRHWGMVAKAAQDALIAKIGEPK